MLAFVSLRIASSLDFTSTSTFLVSTTTGGITEAGSTLATVKTTGVATTEVYNLASGTASTLTVSCFS